MKAACLIPGLKRWALVPDGEPIITLGSRLLPVRMADPQDIVVLHGDLHHDNVLDFGPRDWLAIDPKRVTGERGFDYANLICNPELPTATDSLRFQRQVEVVADAAGLEHRRLLQWVLAFAGLSAAWFLEDNGHLAAGGQLQVAKLAASKLDA